MSRKRRRAHAVLVWLERTNKIMRRHHWPFKERVTIDLTPDAWNYVYSYPNKSEES